MNDHICMYEVELALIHAKANKAAGLDYILFFSLFCHETIQPILSEFVYTIRMAYVYNKTYS